MDIIDACFDFYIDPLGLSFDSNGGRLQVILDGDPTDDDLVSFVCDAERHGFEYGFRFALAIQLLNDGVIRIPQDLADILKGGLDHEQKRRP